MTNQEIQLAQELQDKADAIQVAYLASKFDKISKGKTVAIYNHSDLEDIETYCEMRDVEIEVSDFRDVYHVRIAQ